MRWLCALCLGLVAQGVAGELPQGVYIWQREITPAVNEASRMAASEVNSVELLAAEGQWTADGGHSISVRPPSVLCERDTPVGIVVRMAGVKGDPDGFEEFAIGLCRKTLEREKRAGLSVTELQIDYDCAESGLSAYAGWLSRVRASVAPLPVSFTALPSWLRHPAEFATLASAADGFVLQVHSLDKPTGPDQPFTLCDTQKARTWVMEAGRFGQPFRIALPTYGYRIGFDVRGTFIGLEAEGKKADWPQGTQVRAIFADPVGLAGLVHDWEAAPPRNCKGLLWFRMPIPTDTLTWAAVTWHSVMSGEVPISRMEVATKAAGGLVEVSLVNRGQRSELPAVVRLSWPEGEVPVASDAFGGFVLESHEAQSEEILRAARLAEGDRLVPGQRRAIAWIRFSHDVPLVASVEQAP